jgi:hypothetical protein
MADVPHLRVSDQDREQAASAIREHYAAGRLDSTELEERVQAAYSARTRSELDALSADLPALPSKPPTTMELARQTFNTNALVRNAGAGGAAFLACTAIWALSGADSDFWPRWVLIVTLVMIVRGFMRGAHHGGRISSEGGGVSSDGGGIGPDGGRGGGEGGGHSYSYRYEYRHGHGHQHEHQHSGDEE